MDLGAAKTGQPVRIKAVQGGKYILGEGEKGIAPENITIKRVGKNLHIALEGSDPDQPDLIIENFEGTGGQLVGIAEDGSYYPYISSDADQDRSAAFLYEGIESPQVLGAQSLAGFGNGLVAGSGIGWFWPALLGLGALGLLGGIYAATRDSDSKKDGVAAGSNPDKGAIGGAHDDVGDKRGDILPGESTDDRTPTFTGIGRPGTSVEIVDNGKTIGTAIVGEDGKWTFTPAEPGLSDGSHNIVIIPVDQDGNKGEPSPGHQIIVDTVAPGRPLIEGVFDDVAPNEGLIASGGHTNDTTPTLSGTAEAGTIVRILDNGVEIGSVLADADGKWSFTPDPALAEGAHEFTLISEDAAGNVSLPSLPFPIIVDTTAPTKPGAGTGAIELVQDNFGPDQDDIKNGDTTDDKTPTFQGGGATPGDTVVIIDNGVEIGTAIVGEDGRWEFTPEEPGLGDGPHEIVVVIRDPAGNDSEPSDPWIVIVDATAPAAPTIGSVVDDQGNVIGPIGQDGTTDDAQPHISGTAEPGSLVIIYDNGIAIGSERVDADGNWSHLPVPALLNGSHVLTVTATDPAGNVSQSSGEHRFELIAGGTPTAPSITGVADDVADGIGNISPDGHTNDTLPEVSGTAEPFAIIQLFVNGVPAGSIAADAAGRWAITPNPALSEGANDLTVTATNAAGNTSVPSGPYPITVDTTAPAAADGTLTDNVGTIAPIEDGDTTDDSTPTFNGTAEPHATVIISLGNGDSYSVKVDADGNWTFTPPSLKDGSYSFSTVVVDDAGNRSAASTPINFTIDTRAVVISIDEAGDNVGVIRNPLVDGGVTDDTTPTLSGRGTPGGTVTIYVDGKALPMTATVDSLGRWSFEINPALAEGNYVFTATVTTPAGGESAPTAPFRLEIDLTPSAAPTIDSITDDVGSVRDPLVDGSTTDDTTPTLRGTGVAGETIIIRNGGVELHRVTVNPDGSWSFTPNPPLNNGSTNVFTVVSQDAAGNQSVPSGSWTIIVDTTAPVAPQILSLIDDVGAVTDPVGSGGHTDDSRPEITGTAEPGSTVTIFLDGVPLGTVTADSTTGDWSYQVVGPLPFGANEFTVNAKDGAGNVSPTSSTFEVFVSYSGFSDFEADALGDIPLGVARSLSGGLSATWIGSGSGAAIANDPNGIGKSMVVSNTAKVRIELSGVSESVEFRTAGWGARDHSPGGTAIVRFFDVNGKEIDTVNISGKYEQVVPVSYSTSGSLIAYFEIEVFDVSGITLDNIQWGAGTAKTSVNELNGIGESSESSATAQFFIVEQSKEENIQAAGGDNIDTLKLAGANQILDLTALAEKVTSIEIVDLTGTGNNTLNLSLGDVLAQGDSSLFTGDSATQMMIKGNAGDVVNLDDLLPDGTDPGDWATVGTTTVAGVTYNVYQHSTLDAQLLVQDGVTTNLV
ncbi:hemagglutinin/hemolysin-related protein [Pseudomonas fluorescens WH6]|nr:hemagglutinin/hemolysin-related protein [Pseudomonas fluorescens WH6]